MSKVECIHCGSLNTRNKGYNRNQTKRYKCRDCDKGFSVVPTVEVQQYINRFDDNNYDRYVITSAQNSTKVVGDFLKSIENYCKENNAQLIVIPLRYRNPTSIMPTSSDDWWDARIEKYLCDERKNITRNLLLLGDIKTQPTATRPLSGLDTMTGESSGIVGHPKIEWRSVATRNDQMSKIMTTTGSITEPNFTDSKTGKKGEHFFSNAACVVERDGDLFHIRHIHWNGKSFTDWDKEYSPRGVKIADRPEALVMGDVHQWFIDDSVDECINGPGGVVDTLFPKRLVLHDVCDSYSISHHHKTKPFTQLAKYKTGMNSLTAELESLKEWLIEIKKNNVETLIVPSNHDYHIQRWIEETDWRSQPWNAEVYLEIALEMVKQTEMTTSGAKTLYPFRWWVQRNVSGSARVIEGSLYVKNIELGMHGEHGPNGTRGSIDNISKLGCKSVIGHAHSPGIRDGCYQVGTSTGQLEYSKDKPSSWLNTMCIVYADGKRTLFTVLNGKCKLK